MCDYIERLLAYLRPQIVDLDGVKSELDKTIEMQKQVNDFFTFTNYDIKKIKDFSNQDLIENNFKELKTNLEEYNAMNYLLDTDDEFITKLPQYDEAKEFMNKVLDYFAILKEVLYLRVNDLQGKYQNKYVANKYYNIFSNKDLYIEDPNEFATFIKEIDISSRDKESILLLSIKSNCKYYLKESNSEIDRKQELLKIQQIIYDNKDLLDEEHLKLLESVRNYVNISSNIKEIINEELLSVLDINSIFLAKKIQLVKDIMSCYKSCEFVKVSNYIKEYEYLEDVGNKIKDKKNNKEIVRIIKGGY